MKTLLSVVLAVALFVAFSPVSNACVPKPKPKPEPTNVNTNKNTNVNANTNLNTNRNTNTNKNYNKQSQGQIQKQGQAQGQFINDSGNSTIKNSGNSSIKDSGNSVSKSKVKSDIAITDNSIQEDRREFASPVTGPQVDPWFEETEGDRPNLKSELVLFFDALKILSVDQLDSLGEFVKCDGHSAYLTKRIFKKDDAHMVEFTTSRTAGTPLAVVVLRAKEKCSMLELVGVIGDYASQVKAGKAYIVDAGYKKIIKGSGYSINAGGGFSSVTDKTNVGRSEVASSGIGFGKAETDEAYIPWVKILLMK